MTYVFRYAGPGGDGIDALPDGIAPAVGSEYCTHLLPSEEELRRAIALARGRRLPLLLLTPYLRDAELRRIMALIRVIPRDAPVVAAVNDWGLLCAARTLVPWLDMTVGRLLSGQKRCPRIGASERVNTAGKALQGEGIFSSGRAREHLRRSFGVSGYHVDRLPYGPDVLEGGSLGAEGTSPCLFVHAPYAIVTVSDVCPWIGGRSSAGIESCPRPCRHGAVRLREPSMGKEMILKGKARFVDMGDGDARDSAESPLLHLVRYDGLP